MRWSWWDSMACTARARGTRRFRRSIYRLCWRTSPERRSWWLRLWRSYAWRRKPQSRATALLLGFDGYVLVGGAPFDVEFGGVSFGVLEGDGHVFLGRRRWLGGH